MSERLKINEEMTVGKSQPTEQEISALAAEGFGSVVDLRQATEPNQPLPPSREREAVERGGMRYLHLPVVSDRLGDDTLDRFHEEVSRLPKPVFVHCASGKRSGTLALMHQAVAERISGQEVARRADAAGVAYGPQDQRDDVAAFVDERSKG